VKNIVARKRESKSVYYDISNTEAFTLLCLQVGPASKECKSDSEVEELLKKQEVVVVSYLTEKEEKDVFSKVAGGLRESVAFGHAPTRYCSDDLLIF